MGLCFSTTSRVRSTERAEQSTISDESLATQQSPCLVSIHILDDDSLLNMFNLYRPYFLGEDERELDHLEGGLSSWHRGRWWYQLAHVCQRWRNLILGSASYLRLSLVCTNGTPIENMLTHSPPLPLTIDYFSNNGITAEDEEDIFLVLEQRHRVRHLRLVFPVQNLQKLVTALDKEFPILEYLIVYPSTNDSIALVLPETFQTPHLRQLLLGSFDYPRRPRLHPTAAGLVTLCLLITHPSAYLQPNLPQEWISSMPQLETLRISFTFAVPNRDVERQLTHTPITTHIALPNLRYFDFQGVSAYLEAIVCRIMAPRLETLRIQLFNQLAFSVPRLHQFMNGAENLRLDYAMIMFWDMFVNIGTRFGGDNRCTILVMVGCRDLDWQVSSAVQISNALSQVFISVEHLALEHEIHSQSSEEHNDVDRVEWRNLLRPFSNVKTLRVQDGLVEELSRSLRLEDGEPPLELLPELQELSYVASRDTGAFASFIDARQNAGRPVTLFPQIRSPPSSPRLSTVISLRDEAGNDIET